MTDKPNTLNEQYKAMAPVWQACRDASTGQRAIHAGDETYLPKLTGQTPDEYKSYKARAQFFNATGRTVDGMSGLVFRKDIQVDVPKGMESWLDDITLSGKNLIGFSQEATEETIKVGRGGILVDVPQAPELEEGTAITVSQAENIAMRPYFTLYKAENIINWRRTRIGNVTRISQVFLSETYEDESGEDADQIRELTLLTKGGDYNQVIYRLNDGGEWFEYDRILPQRQGKPLFEIPFYFLAAKDPDENIQDPPIEDLVYTNISHYLNSASIENGAHLSGLPTLYVTGVSDDAPSLHIGSNTAWILPDKDSKAGFIQVGADGFASLEKLMDRKEQQMAAQGARLIAPEKKAAETAETAQVRRGGENSVLASLARSVEMQIEKALRFAAEWAAIDGDVRFEMNKDYLPTPMGPKMLTAWVAAWQSGAVSEMTFYEGLQSGELVAETMTFEEEQERKADSGPA